MDSNNRNNEFLSKLKDLLVEYDASINFDCAECSDIYGIYNPHICISVGNKDIKNVDGWGIDKTIKI